MFKSIDRNVFNNFYDSFEEFFNKLNNLIDEFNNSTITKEYLLDKINNYKTNNSTNKNLNEEIHGLIIPYEIKIYHIILIYCFYKININSVNPNFLKNAIFDIINIFINIKESKTIEFLLKYIEENFKIDLEFKIYLKILDIKSIDRTFIEDIKNIINTTKKHQKNKIIFLLNEVSVCDYKSLLDFFKILNLKIEKSKEDDEKINKKISQSLPDAKVPPEAKAPSVAKTAPAKAKAFSPPIRDTTNIGGKTSIEKFYGPNRGPTTKIIVENISPLQEKIKEINQLKGEANRKLSSIETNITMLKNEIKVLKNEIKELQKIINNKKNDNNIIIKFNMIQGFKNLIINDSKEVSKIVNNIKTLVYESKISEYNDFINKSEEKIDLFNTETNELFNDSKAEFNKYKSISKKSSDYMSNNCYKYKYLKYKNKYLNLCN